MYKFTKDSIANLSGAGIYIFYHKGIPIYVGQTKNFRNRLSTHYHEAFTREISDDLHFYMRYYQDEIMFDVFPTEERLEEEKRLIQELNPQFNRQLRKQEWLYKYENKKYTINPCIENDKMKILRAALPRLTPKTFILFFEFLSYSNEFIFNKEKIIAATKLCANEIKFAMEELEDKGFIYKDVFYLVPIPKVKIKETKPKIQISEQEKEKIRIEEEKRKREQEQKQKQEKLKNIIDEYLDRPLTIKEQEEIVQKTQGLIEPSMENYTILTVIIKIKNLGYKVKNKKSHGTYTYIISKKT